MRLHAVRADAGGAGAVDVASRRRSSRRALAFAGAYVFMQVGRTPVHAVGDAARQPRQLSQLPAHQRLAGAVARVFWIAGAFADGGRAARGCGPSRWRSNTSRRRSASGRPGSAARPRPTGTSTAATWPSAAGCSSSSRWASRCWSPARPSPSCLDARRRSRPSSSRSSAAWRCGGSTSTSAPRRASRRIAHSSDPGRLARLAYTYMHLPAGRRHHRRPPSPTSWCSRIPTGHTGPRRRCRAAGRPGALSARQHAVQAGDRRPAAAVASGRPGAAGSCWCRCRSRLQPLVLGGATTLVLVVVAVWETLSLRGLAGPEPAVEIPPSGDKASDKMPAG